MVYSPLNIVPKAGSPMEFQLIHDLAYPYTDQSVNSCIPPSNASVQYHYIDEVMEMALKLGTATWGARIDIKHAFRNQPMHKDDLHLLGFTFMGKHYINSSLPFGAASSCLIFEWVASALQWIITDQTGITTISHFLDDFPMLRQSEPQLKQFMLQFMHIMKDIGMPIADDKTLGPTQILEYLGWSSTFRLNF